MTESRTEAVEGLARAIAIYTEGQIYAKDDIWAEDWPMFQRRHERGDRTFLGIALAALDYLIGLADRTSERAGSDTKMFKWAAASECLRSLKESPDAEG